MKVNDFYTSVLESVGATVDGDGRIVIQTSEAALPVAVANAGNRVLYLATPEQMNNPDWDKRIYFHPLSESFMGGESEVLHTLRDMIQFRLTEQIYLSGESLLLLAMDDKRQGKLKDNQMDVMKQLAETDETTVSHFRSIISASTVKYEGGEDRRLVAMYLKRGGNHKGRACTRVCVTNFPVYDALRKLEGKKAKDCKVFGIDLRLKDVKILTALFEILFPKIDEDNEFYSDGTESRTAPYFTSLMNSYLKIADALNQTAMLFSRVCKEMEKIQTKWGEHMDSLPKFNGELPALPFNQGTDDDSKPAAADNTPPWDTSAPTQQPAQQQKAPAKVSKEKPSELMSRIRQHFQASGSNVSTQPQPITVQAQPQQQVSGNQTVGGWGAPVNTAQPPQQQPAAQHTGGNWWSAPATPVQQPVQNNGWGTPPQQQQPQMRQQVVVGNDGRQYLLTLDPAGNVVNSQPMNTQQPQQPAANWSFAPSPQPANNGWGAPAQNNGWGAPQQNNNGWGGNTSGGWQ